MDFLDILLPKPEMPAHIIRPLFDREPVPGKQPTSRLASEQLVPESATLRARVYECLLAAPGGLTDEQLQEATGMNPSTQRPRRIELVDAALVIDSGTTRATKSGRAAIVWKALS